MSNPSPSWGARLYLDVDGVLAPLPDPQDVGGVWPPATWPRWVDPHVAHSTPFPVRVLDDLVALAAAGRVEVVWATTWPAGMIHEALASVGYPQLRFRHLAEHGRIDKTVAVRGDVLADPLPFVWIDDSRWPGDMRWRTPVRRLRLTPDSHAGVTPVMWAHALAWLNDA